MKYIKLILISAFFFFGMFTIIGLLFPSQINTTRAVVINKQPQQILSTLSNVESWKAWYPFFKVKDSGSIAMAGNSTVFQYQQLKLRIDNFTKDSNSVSFKLTAANNFEVADKVIVLPIAKDAMQSQVVWNENEHLRWYPWERFRGLFLERTRGMYIDTALYRLRDYLEKQ
jgi:hypothetical protein